VASAQESIQQTLQQPELALAQAGGGEHEAGVAEAGHPDGSLVYGMDRRLREREVVRVGFEATAGSPWGCMVVGGHEYEIVREGRTGWHFSLLDRESGEQLYEFSRFRVLPGGTITGKGSRVTIRETLLRNGRWTFTSDDGWQVRATRTRRYPGRELRLEHVGLMGVPSSEALLLAFGTWILVEWESVPVGGGGG
jgi:hypothetical protein